MHRVKMSKWNNLSYIMIVLQIYKRKKEISKIAIHRFYYVINIDFSSSIKRMMNAYPFVKVSNGYSKSSI